MVGDLRTLLLDERASTRRAMIEEIERTQPEVLSPEFRTLRRHFKSLLAQHRGHYVAIFGDKILGVWPDYDEADREVFRRLPHKSVTIIKLEEDADLPAAVAVDCLGEILRRSEPA